MPCSTSHSARSTAATAAAVGRLLASGRCRSGRWPARRPGRPGPGGSAPPSRTAAPCPLAGHGCRPAAGPFSVTSIPVRLPISRPGLPAGQLGHVGVLLLGEHRAPGGEGVVEDGEPELLGRPQHQLLPDPGEVDAEEGQVEEGLGHEVTVGHGVERVLEPGGEAQVLGHAVGVEGQRRTGQGARTQRRDVEPVHRGQQPVDVPGQGPAVGQQVVGQQHRLGPLQMGVARAGRRRRPRWPGSAAPPAGPGSRRPRRSAPAWRRAGGRWRSGRCGSDRCGAWRPRRRRSR